jgi:PAS domain S-box-containing protein
VETESQFQLLLGKGCSNFQGYLFGKPVPLKEFELLIGKLHEKAQDFSSVSVTDTDLLAENGLRQRYHHLIAVIDNLPSMIGYWDKNMRNRFGNMAYSSWFGITPAQMLGKHIREVIGEERFQLNLPYIEGVLRGERQEFERDIPAPDGKQIRQSFAQYIPDIVNGEVRGFFIQVSDIGSVKHAEAEIKRSEAKFRKLFDSTADAVILFDENGFFDCNRATLEMFRCASKSEFYSKQPEDLSPQYQTNGRASKEFAQEQVALALRDGTVRFEWLNKRLDSEDTFPSEILLSAMDLDDRQMLQCVIRDIGERRKNEEAFIVAKNEAEVANRAKSAFLSVVSHELRTPLNGILGMTELLQSSELDEDQREYADTVIDCGNNLLLIINEILDYSNIEKGMLGLSAKSCDMGVLIDECFAMEAHLAKSKGLEMTTSWSGSALEKYFLDVDHLKQMLLNLIDNAIKFTAHGFVKIEARIVEKQAKLHVLEFSVTDSGIGISEDKQKMLFRPFTQLDSSSTRSYGGTGIGLSIVSKLSGLMGGECGVESELQKGSRFWFRIKAEIFDGQIIENNECRKR